MKSIADIKAIRDKMQADKTTRETSKDGDVRIVVGMATCGIAAGARPVFNALIDEVANVILKTSRLRAQAASVCANLNLSSRFSCPAKKR